MASRMWPRYTASTRGALIHDVRFRQNAVAEIGAQRPFREQIDATSQLFGKLPFDPHEIQQALATREVRQQIDIAGGGVVTTRD